MPSPLPGYCGHNSPSGPLEKPVNKHLPAQNSPVPPISLTIKAKTLEWPLRSPGLVFLNFGPSSLLPFPSPPQKHWLSYCSRNLEAFSCPWAFARAIATAWKSLPQTPRDRALSLELSSNVPPQHSLPGSPSHTLASCPQLLHAPHPRSVPSPQRFSVASLPPVACSSCLTGRPRKTRFHLRVPGASQCLPGQASEALGRA